MYHQLKSSTIILNKTSNYKVAITEIYPQVPRELVADPLGPAEQTSGTTDVNKLSNHTHVRTHTHTVEQ